MYFPKSLELVNIWPPAPTVSREESTILSAKPDGTAITYVAGESVYVRSVDEPNTAIQFSEHKTTARVARFSTSGRLIASGDKSGTVKIWFPGSDEGVHKHVMKASHDVISGQINDLAWDADDSRLLVVGNGKNTRGKCIMYDSGNSLGTLVGHTSKVTAVSLRTKRPFKAVTCDENGVVCFHKAFPIDLATTYNDIHQGRALGAQFSPNGMHIASVSGIPNCKVALQTLDEKSVPGPARIFGSKQANHSGTISSISWASDSSRFVTASADKTVRIWDVETGTNTETFKADPVVDYSERYEGQFVGVVWMPNRQDERIISIDLAGNLHHFEPGNPTPVRTVLGHSDFVNTSASALVGSTPTLYTGGSNGRVLAWDLSKDSPDPYFVKGNSMKKKVTTILPPPESSPQNGIKIANWHDDIRSCDLKDGSLEFGSASVALESQAAASARVVAQGSNAVFTLSLLSEKNTVSVVKDGSNQVSEVKLSDIKAGATCLASYKSWVVVGDSDGHIWSYTLTHSGEPKLVPFEDHKSKASLKAPIEIIRISPQGEHVAVAGPGGAILVFAAKGVQLGSSPAKATISIGASSWVSHSGTVTALEWHPEGKILASGSVDMTIRLWTLEDQWARVVQQDALKAPSVGFVWRKKPSGEYSLISLARDSSIKVWDLQS